MVWLAGASDGRVSGTMKGFRLVYPALLCVVLLIPLSQVSCGPDHPPPPQLFNLEMIADRETCTPGENVTADISLTNVYGQAYTVRPFPPTVLVGKLDTGLPAYPIVAIFPGMADEGLLQPGQSLNWSVSWDQKNQEGNQVPPGRYIFELEFWTVRDGQLTEWGATGSVIKIETTEE